MIWLLYVGLLLNFSSNVVGEVRAVYLYVCVDFMADKFMEGSSCPSVKPGHSQNKLGQIIGGYDNIFHMNLALLF